MAFGSEKKDKTMDETSQTSESTEEQEGVEAPAGAAHARGQLEAARAERDEVEQKWLSPGGLPEPPPAHRGGHRRGRQPREVEVLAEAITVLDYLDMALAAPVTTDEAKNLKVGVEMTRALRGSSTGSTSSRSWRGTGCTGRLYRRDRGARAGAIVESCAAAGAWARPSCYAQVRVAAAPEAEETAETEEGPSEDGE